MRHLRESLPRRVRPAVFRAGLWPCLAAAVAALGLATAVVGAPTPRPSRPTAAAAAANTPAAVPTRLRQGAELVDCEGDFRVVGDRVVFFSADGKLRLTGLENQALERVARVLANWPATAWKVSGTITEYRGGNYLLLRRAVVVGPNEAGGTASFDEN